MREFLDQFFGGQWKKGKWFTLRGFLGEFFGGQ